MSDNLKRRISKGDKGAFSELYEANKERVFYISYLLLGSKNAADEATRHIFKNAFSYIISNPSEAESFSKFIEKRAVNYCKTRLAYKNPKSFKIPTSKNFRSVEYLPSDFVADDDGLITILLNFPSLHRTVYVTRGLLEWDEAAIAELLHTNLETARLAIESEESNFSALLKCAETKGIELLATDVDTFHKLLKERGGEQALSSRVDDAVATEIKLCTEPIKMARKNKNKKALLISSLSVAIVIILTCFVWAVVALSTKETVDNTDDEEYYDEDFEEDYNDENEDGENYNEGAAIYDSTVWQTKNSTTTHYVEMDVKDLGKITLALDGTLAPETVTNFTGLAKKGFYDGLTFHRIIDGFMIQGGDPLGTGYGGNTDADGNEINVKGEFAYNAVANPLSHVRGAISMARSDPYDSASSQFFIVHEDSTDLDGLYAVFGYVTEGIEVVDAICEAATPIDNNGTIEKSAQPVINTVTVYTAEEYFERYPEKYNPSESESAGESESA